MVFPGQASLTCDRVSGVSCGVLKRDPYSPIPHTSTLVSPGVSPGGGGSLGGCRGSSGRGRVARSSLCCPGCGLWWTGGLCSVCNVRVW